ncbi:MAG: VirB4 family type IV secretion system protein [Solirubrobacteraceae bacterium]
MSGTRTGSLGRLLPVDLVEPDGLLVTSDRRYVRLIECERMPNAITADASAQAKLERAFGEICRGIPDRQALSIYAQTDPIPVEEALAEDHRRVELAVAHDRRRGQEDLAQARRWLLSAQQQSVVHAAGSEQPAVAARWWLAVPHEPQGEDVADRFRQALTPGGVRTAWRSHQRAAADSLRQADQVQAQLATVGIEPWPLDGVQALACLWERLHPAARQLPDMDALAAATAVAGATTAERAAAQRHRILEVVCGGLEPTGLDASDPRWLRHADGTLEEILHLGTPPLQTTLWWLMHLLACPLPVTVAVHIRVGSRDQIRARQRRRWKRLSAAIDYKHRRAHLVGSDEHEALAEAELLDAELAGEIGATVYKVSISVAIRDPRGEPDAFDMLVKSTAREFQAHTGARVIRGRWLGFPGLTSTIPLGVDRLRVTRSYAHRNIAHCLPLTSGSCGSPDGLILGFADPGGTLERLNPFDRLYTRHVTLAIGPSGGGKTVTINALLERAISQGMRGWIIDRSSTAGEHGGRGSGHYDMLLGLIPGSRRVQVGSGDGEVICPWDVRDPSRVRPEKEQFLLALHALLIGDQRGSEDRTLSALEESFLLSGIRLVYEHCARTGDRPRETLLLRTLGDRLEKLEPGGLLADTLHSLIVRLEPYCEGGAFAHLTDAQTTVPSETTLTLFDIAGLPDRLVPPMILAIVDHIEGAIQRTRSRRLHGQLDDAGAWAGRLFLVVEEGWKLTASAAAGAWLNEYARRSRHYALWLIFVSQFFRDLATAQGHALLENKAIALCFQNDADDLEHARAPLALTDADVEQITTLTTRPGLYSGTYMISARGRGAVRQLLGDLEYWICCSDPENDQPRRAAALTESDGNHWAALRLLCTPEWHERYRQQGRAA